MRKRIIKLVLILALIASILPQDMMPVSAVDYPTSLVNGGFEYPTLSLTYNQWWTDYVPPVGVEEQFGWKTTATNKKFEFGGDWHVSGWGINFIPEGRQFIELNASEQAAVYQDISTTPGSIIYWSLYQGGVWYTNSQNINNTMAVRIGTPEQLDNATMKSQNLTDYDQEWTKRTIYELGEMTVVNSTPEAYSGKDSNKKQLYTEPKRWTKYEGVYVVPEGQTLTRFAFASLSAIPLQGNLLDGVVFRLATEEEINTLAVGLVKKTIESTTYTMTQAAATDESAITAGITAKLATLELDGVTPSVTKVLYTPAIAGDATTPAGTNGSYTFQINLSKGSATATTITLTMEITATYYVEPNQEQAAPTGLSSIAPSVALNDGKIRGTSNLMEYKLASADDTAYVSCSNTETVLTAGNYVVRFAAKTGFNASPTTAITVPSYVAPTPSVNTASPTKKTGQLVKDQQQDETAPNTNLSNSTEEIKKAVFTKEELAKIAAGETAKVILKVTDMNDLVSDEEKELIQKSLDQDYSLMYIDLSLYKKIGNGAETKVSETIGKIGISIEVPEELRSANLEKNREYKIVRIHEGEVTIIEGTYDPETHLFTFETDRFSTYALAYEDLNDEKNTQSNISNSKFYHLRLTAKATETSQTISYTKIPKADGYILYGSPCGINNKLTKLADVSANTTSYNHKGLLKETYYKYFVQAYQVINGKKVIIANSKIIHSITKSNVYANPLKVISDTTSVLMGVGEYNTVSCSVLLPENKKIEQHVSEIRYETTNEAVAKVDKNGKIKAISKGTCYVYAYAQNGVYKRIKVRVQ